jgi:hypothetical protein
VKKHSFPAISLLGAEYGSVWELTPEFTIQLVEDGELIPNIEVELGK